MNWPTRALLPLLVVGSAHAQTHSQLWGQNGESWNPTGRLGDYSYAGYRTGNVPIPDRIGNRINVLTVGAVPSDGVDDTHAFRQAIALATAGQAVYAPAGTYHINDVLEIRKSGISLQGDGAGLTILYFDKSLTQLRGPNGTSGIVYPVEEQFPCVQTEPPPTLDSLTWSFAGGEIWIQGDDPIDATTKLTTVIQDAQRGGKTLVLASGVGISTGMWIRLTETDPPRTGPTQGSLVRHLHGDLVDGGCEQRGRMLVDFHSRVSGVTGNVITLERHLPVDVRTVWRPEIHRYNPTVQDVGVEHLTLKFKTRPYSGHFNEEGYNGIFLAHVANCWVRDVEIIDADSGIFAAWTHFTTFDGITIRATPGRVTTAAGHHAYDFYFLTSDNLLTNFNIATRYIHDLTTEQYASGNVFSNGTGENINLDHHMSAPHHNLYTNLNLGIGGRPFESAGGGDRGPQTARYSTLWNVSANNNLSLPSCLFGPQMTFVGVRSTTSSACPAVGWWVENIVPSSLSPQNIHEAQRARRTGGGGGASSSCGNGSAENGEQCDGGDLNGQTCTSQGFPSGTLSCTPSCTLYTGGCGDNTQPPSAPTDTRVYRPTAWD